MNRSEVEDMLAEVRANHALLDGCATPHDFKPASSTPRIGGRMVCTKCGGWVDAHAARWYAAGVAHGREVQASADAKFMLAAADDADAADKKKTPGAAAEG